MEMSGPVFSIAIPARNGRRRLENTFRSIAGLNFDLSRLEVLVVDDGSTDDTWAFLQECRVPFPLRSERIDEGNQSAGTNHAIRMAQGEYILGSAQDILFHPEMLNRHLRRHQAAPDEDLVVLGSLPYPDGLDVTPFMFYLVNGGFQFGHFMIQDRERTPANFLYAPNFSARAGLLERTGLFDESFPYGCQDIDLGIRLAMNGARFVFEPEAIGYHDHPVTLESYKDRQEKVGRARHRLQAKHPEFVSKTPVWDMVLTRYLGYGACEIDRDEILVRQLESRVLEQGDRYRELWSRALETGVPLDRFAPSDRQVLQTVRGLFECYERLLLRPWAKGYLEEAIEVEGPETVRRNLLLQSVTNQTTLQLRKIVAGRLRAYGIEPPAVSPGEILTTLVVHDLPDYGTALNLLDGLKEEGNGPFNNEILFCDTRSVLSRQEKEHLAETVTVIDRGDRGGEVLEAIRIAQGSTILVMVGCARPRLGLYKKLAGRLLGKVAGVALLGGEVQDPSTGDRKYRYGSGAEPVEVETVAAELCLLEKETAREILGASGEPGLFAGDLRWNERLSLEVRKRGWKIFYVPELLLETPWRAEEPSRRKRKAG